MDLGLHDKVFFVAGSSRGIGLAIATSALREGARVAITGRASADVERAERSLAETFGRDRVFGFAGDLTDGGTIARALDAVRARWGAVDCAVANVGSGTARPGWELSADDWDAAYRMNLWGSVRLAEAVLPYFSAEKRGVLVFMASIVALESVSAPLSYASAKAALVNYSKNLARQVGPSGVRVVTVAPGNILFPGGTWEQKLAQDRPRFEHYVQTEVALQRFGTPEEVADVTVFLASDRAKFVAGSCVVVDGGQTRSV